MIDFFVGPITFTIEVRCQYTRGGLEPAPLPPGPHKVGAYACDVTVAAGNGQSLAGSSDQRRGGRLLGSCWNSSL